MTDNKNNLTLVAIFSIYFFIGIFIYKDYGIGIEEHFQRQNGFYWLSQILNITDFENLKVIVNQKYQSILLNNPDLPKSDFFNFYGILFDVPTALIESLFAIENSKIYFEIRHILNFIVFFAGSIFFYKILSKRFDFVISVLGLLIYIATPRIFGDSFHNNKDVFFLSLFTIALYYCFEVLNKDSFKNIIIFSLFAAFATSSRIIAIFFPFSVIIFLFFEFLSKKKQLNDFLIKSLVLLSFFSIFLFLHFPYVWTLEFTNILNWLDPFFYHMNMNILFDGNYYKMNSLPVSYLPKFIFITTPFYYSVLFAIGFFYLLLRFFRRILSVKETSFHNDFWRGIKEKKDSYIIIFLLVFLFYGCFFNVPFVSGWRFFYFLHAFIVYIAVFALDLIYLRFFKSKKKIFLFSTLSFLPILLILYQIILFHPYQSLYFNFFINTSNVVNFQVDTPSLSRSEALKKILTQSRDEKVISVGNASWTPFQNGKDILEPEDQKKFNFVGQEYEKADYIYTNYIYEVDPKYNKKYKIPDNFTKIEKLIINGIPIYSIYKKSN